MYFSIIDVYVCVCVCMWIFYALTSNLSELSPDSQRSGRDEPVAQQEQ